MDRYISVDCGKLDTKVASYNPVDDTVKIFSFKTKYGNGLMEDDAIEAGTFIVSYDGKTYKVGNGASTYAELSTSKMTQIHKICTLSAIALCCSDNETDDVTVAIGIPVSEYLVVEKRQEYKNFILPEGEINICLKKKSEGEIVERKFRITGRYVYPETGGAIYVDPVRYLNKTVGVVDIGNLNVNMTLWNNFELDNTYSLTSELGGSILLSGLSQELTSRFGRVDEKYVLKVLLQGSDNRKLVPNKPNAQVEKESADFITDYLLQFVEKIKRQCDSKQWSIDFIDLVFIGGTSGILSNEIVQIFGETAYVPEKPQFVNVNGFLKRLVGYKLGIVIPNAIYDSKGISSGEKPIENKK